MTAAETFYGVNSRPTTHQGGARAPRVSEDGFLDVADLSSNSAAATRARRGEAVRGASFTPHLSPRPDHVLDGSMDSMLQSHPTTSNAILRSASVRSIDEEGLAWGRGAATAAGGLHVPSPSRTTASLRLTVDLLQQEVALLSARVTAAEKARDEAVAVAEEWRRRHAATHAVCDQLERENRDLRSSGRHMGGGEHRSSTAAVMAVEPSVVSPLSQSEASASPVPPPLPNTSRIVSIPPGFTAAELHPRPQSPHRGHTLDRADELTPPRPQRQQQHRPASEQEAEEDDAALHRIVDELAVAIRHRRGQQQRQRARAPPERRHQRREASSSTADILKQLLENLRHEEEQEEEVADGEEDDVDPAERSRGQHRHKPWVDPSEPRTPSSSWGSHPSRGPMRAMTANGPAGLKPNSLSGTQRSRLPEPKSAAAVTSGLGPPQPSPAVLPVTAAPTRQASPPPQPVTTDRGSRFGSPSAARTHDGFDRSTPSPPRPAPSSPKPTAANEETQDAEGGAAATSRNGGGVHRLPRGVGGSGRPPLSSSSSFAVAQPASPVRGSSLVSVASSPGSSPTNRRLLLPASSRPQNPPVAATHPPAVSPLARSASSVVPRTRPTPSTAVAQHTATAGGGVRGTRLLQRTQSWSSFEDDSSVPTRIH